MLVARAAEARDVLPDAARARPAPRWRSWRSTRRCASSSTDRLERLAGADYVTFTSSSTVRFLLESHRRARTVPARPHGSCPSGRSRATRRASTASTVHVEAAAPRHRRPRRGAAGRCAVARRRLLNAAALVPLRLRARRRVRRRLPRRRAADRAGRGRHRRHARACRATRCASARCALQNAIPYLPQGVHIAVVDPGVGGERRPVALRAARRKPLRRARQRAAVARGRRPAAAWREAVDIAESPHRLEPVSATFHGRDLFAPVAAHLALGAALEDAGRAIDPATLERLELPPPEVSEGRIRTRVVAVDALRQPAAQPARRRHARGGVRARRLRRGALAAGARARPSTRARSPTSASGRPSIIEDSSGRMAVAVNQGRAAGALGVGADAELLLQPCDDH